MLPEKRNEERFPMATSVRYQRKGSQLFSNSVGQNISDSGIGFISHEFFPVATHLIFELQHPKTQEYLKTAGKIVWISSQPHSENFLVGARFIEPVTPL